MRVGTSYFNTKSAALRYYSRQGETVASVNAKIAEGEIHIGRPAKKAGESIGLDADGRWWIIVESSTIVPMGKP